MLLSDFSNAESAETFDLSPCFQGLLSIKDQLFLFKIHEDISYKLNQILSLSHISISAEVLSPYDKNQVIELLSIQRQVTVILRNELPVLMN